jgi:hypothetical protein
MAKLGIVHTDIRFDPTSRNMCNIVYIEENDIIEMALIDYESLTKYPVGIRFEQAYAISHEDVPGVQSAFQFLFLQVLWAAYVWTKEPTYVFTTKARTLVENILANFRSFNDYISNSNPAYYSTRLKQCYYHLSMQTYPDKEREIVDAMDVLSNLFKK